MNNIDLEKAIENAWDNRSSISSLTSGPEREAIQEVLEKLDTGDLRVAAPNANSNWFVNQWVKKAVVLSFRLFNMSEQSGGPQNSSWWDKVDNKFKNWNKNDWQKKNFRAVPNCIVRKSAYIAPGVVLMPSFVNLGAYVGEGTMIDTWATVGSCAQIGKNVHISGGVGIGGVLEPLQANPTIVEDNCFIGARSEVVEGCIIRRGSVLGMGVFIGQSTKILDRSTGKISYGEIPPYSVVVPGAIETERPGVSLSCAVIVKKVDEKTRSKTSINDLLRS